MPSAPRLPLLVLISGEIASGKTSTANRLAAMARQRDIPAASIDMDMMIEMAAGDDWARIEPEQRHFAVHTTARLVETLLQSGLDMIFVAGSTLSPYEWDTLLAGLDSKPHHLFVLLRVSLDEAIRRAKDDPWRTTTRNPEVLRRLASRVDWTRIRDHHIDLVTDGLSLDDVATILSREVFR
jgi:tRNA uridine 5-carbamoylmethylation protein Kti12